MKWIPRWVWLTLGFGTVVLGVGVTAAATEVPYYAFEPGPVYEIDELISVPDGDPLNGETFMLTVILHEVNALEAGLSYLREEVVLVKKERVRPTGVTPEELSLRGIQAMEESKSLAVYVALTQLGHDLEIEGEGVFVGGVLEGTGAMGVLETGDVIKEINGVETAINADAIGVISSYEVGDVLEIKLLRGDSDELITVQVELVQHTTFADRPMVGFLATTYNWNFIDPIGIDIDTSNVGGPSAGLMYTLTLVDLLNEDDILGGRAVAGTGTIDSAGNVGPIGGIQQKIFAAVAEGADIIFVPDGNWDEAVEVDPGTVELVRVETLQDALDYLAGSGA
jgi:PDZ domain-containing protein